VNFLGMSEKNSGEIPNQLGKHREVCTRGGMRGRGTRKVLRKSKTQS